MHPWRIDRAGGASKRVGEWTAAPITRAHFEEWATIFQPPDEEEILLFDTPVTSTAHAVLTPVLQPARPLTSKNDGVTKVLVVRHAEPFVSGEKPGAERPLTAKGRNDIWAAGNTLRSPASGGHLDES